MFLLLFQQSCLEAKYHGANKGQQESCALFAAGSHKTLSDSFLSAKSRPNPPLHLQLQLAWLQGGCTKEGVIHPPHEQYIPEHLGIYQLFPSYINNDFICD